MVIKKEITTIGFDADDTLWVNEPNFREAEQQFCELLENYIPHEETIKRLFDIEMKNLHLYGYGAKNLIISMVETICSVIKTEVSTDFINDALNIGIKLLHKPLILIDGVENVLKKLHGKYRLVMITKGDLIEQERKIAKSGFARYFNHIEIMSHKRSEDYVNMLIKIDCAPENFVMIGNSLKSDILPVLELNSHAIHIPFHITWEHEMHDEEINHPKFTVIQSIGELIEIF